MLLLKFLPGIGISVRVGLGIFQEQNMKKPIIILSPQQMAMEEPYKGKYSYSNSFNSSAVLNAGGLPLIPPYLNYEEALEQKRTIFPTHP